MAVKHCTLKKRRTRSTHHANKRAPVSHRQCTAVQEMMQANPNEEQEHSNTSVASSALGTVSRHSAFSPGHHQAPANAEDIVRRSDTKTASLLNGGFVLALLPAISLQHDIDTSSSLPYQAYLDRFGGAQQVNQKYRDRFSRTLHDTKKEAEAAELTTISDRLANLNDYLDAGIRYISNDRRRIRIGSCRDRCSAHPNWGAWTCSRPGAHGIALCPSFWNLGGGDSERATMIIHELAHMRYRLGHHNFGNVRQRGRNPECYASFVADLFGITPFSDQCPVT